MDILKTDQRTQVQELTSTSDREMVQHSHLDPIKRTLTTGGDVLSAEVSSEPVCSSRGQQSFNS